MGKQKTMIRRAKVRVLRAVDDDGREHSLVDVLEAARMLNSSQDFVGQAARGGLIRVARAVSGGPYLYSQRDVASFKVWLEAAAASPAPVKEEAAPWIEPEPTEVKR